MYSSENDYSILEDKPQQVKSGIGKGKRDGQILWRSIMRPYRKKLERLTMAKRLSVLSECAEHLSFKRDPETGRLKLYQAHFCKVRLCPMCAWRRSLKIAYHNKLIVEEANRQYGCGWIFLTLTVRNIEGEALKPTISDMMKGWNRLFGYKRIKTATLGYFRALEITKNHEADTYHPHFHVLLPVKRNYFGKNYIKQAEWTSLWKRAMKLDYTPIVDIRRVKGKAKVDAEQIESDVREAMMEQKAVLEISKYPVKIPMLCVVAR